MPDAPVLAPPVPDAERRDLAGRAGRVALHSAGRGAPVLLVHSINAAASAYEMRPLFEALRGRRRVHALDLPGYGLSDRSARRYEVPLFVAGVRDAIDAASGEAGGAPVDLVALSLSSEFAARAAVESPGQVRTLTMITPTGLDRRSADMRKPPGSVREVRGLHAVLSAPLWTDALFRGLVSRASVRYFLGRTFGSAAAVPDDLVDYCWASAHQPGARHAPLAFLSGRLFSADVRTLYERLTLPVWVPHGTRGDFKDFSGAGGLADRPNWRLQPFDTGAMPHFERRAEFASDCLAFLER